MTDTLRDIGRAVLLGAWLGIAILAGYAFFAIAVPGAPVRGPALVTGVLALILAAYTAWPTWIRPKS